MKRLEYEVQTPEHVIEAARAWCEREWGARWSVIDNRAGTWTLFWAGREAPGHYRWQFATEQQALLFSLKWQR